ncbi:MAG: endopeptidase La [Sandaracinaceae bacterium]|nr:endopeptidase La [Sandaracinaceae bacterium]
MLATLADPGGVVVLPLVDQVLFPRTVLAVAIGVPAVVEVLQSLPPHRLVVAVRSAAARCCLRSRASASDVGTLARVHRVAEVGAGEPAVVAFLEGIARVRLHEPREGAPRLRVGVELMPETPAPRDVEHGAMQRTIHGLYSEAIEASGGGTPELPATVSEIDEPALLTDFVAWAVPELSLDVRQEMLETADVGRRMWLLIRALVRLRDEQRAITRIKETATQQISDAQRRYFLEEQMRVLRKELGEEGDDHDVDELRRKLAAGELPEAAAGEARRELSRLAHIPREAAEHAIVRGYLEWLAELPWAKSSAEPVDVERAAAILDEDHEDLEKVKERILEYLSVYRLKPQLKGPILCFVGPPGVGKTSLGRSIARALGRKFARISLGGMHDEAEIRGHRRTYIGAMPGQILQAIRQAGTRDPVFMLDEVDKLGKGFHGDPAAALLEVLDPEQNSTFTDNYLGVPFDLSSVLFIATANVLDPVPPALRDRMEALELPGYVDEEKLSIAKKHLVPKQREAHGLGDDQLAPTDAALKLLIRGYTSEHGVRTLERTIASLCRKRAREIVSGADGHGGLITRGRVLELLGPPREEEHDLERRTSIPGVAVALAWTPSGGEVLFVEATRMPLEKGRLVVTGHVGKVMEESARIALSWVRAHAARYGIDPHLLASDLHLHIPAGAVPKDGPSAGGVIAAALVSLFTGRRVRPYVAMTGEVTLSGLLLPIGGIKAKMLAARRHGVREVILPERNRRDAYEEVPPQLRESTALHFRRRRLAGARPHASCPPAVVAAQPAEQPARSL